MFKTIKLAIADDHPLIIEGLQNMLADDSEVEIVATYLSGEELLEKIKKDKPDVLLLDIHMPGIKGDELAKKLTKRFKMLKIIVLTNMDDIYYIKGMLQQGVAGYLLKSIKKETLITAIKTVLNDEHFYDDVIKSRIIRAKEQIRKQAARGSVLTRREKEILKLIAEDYTSKAIADKLHLSKRTIDHHRERIAAKLDVSNVYALIKKAAELGLIEKVI